MMGTCFAGGIGCEGLDRGQSRHCLNAVEIYNPDGDNWRDGPPLPCPQLSLRTNASNAGVVGGKIYVCGYYKGAGSERNPYWCLKFYFKVTLWSLCLHFPQIVMMI